MKNLLFLVLVLFVSSSVFSQSRMIRGQVIDDETGEALIGATVAIEGTTMGAATDLDGKFEIKNLDAGVYNAQVSYVSYQGKVIQSVEVKPEDVTILNVRLKPETIGLQEVVVQAQAIRNSESALLTVQKKASLVLDGISAEQFSRNGDSDAAAAMKRVTGVTVEGGKYVYVRGLGDRYSKTALNSGSVPGLDPDKNSVQMDLFPANLIDNIVVYKTFSPELPASFSGGYIDISTKDFPDRFTFQISASAKYNTNASFNSNFLSQRMGNNFLLGFDTYARQVPEVVEQGIPSPNISTEEYTADARQLDAASKAFNSSFAPSTKIPFLNQSLSMSMGDQMSFLGKPLGIIGGLSYKHEYESYQEGTTGRYFLAGSEQLALDTILAASDVRGTESVLWGGLLSATYKLSPYNKIGLNLIRNQSAQSSARYQQGVYPYRSGIEDGSAQRQIRSLQYLQRSMSTAQLKGEHILGNTNQFKIDWLGSYTYSTQDEPDLRFFNNTFSNAYEDTLFAASGGSNVPPARYFRDMNETNLDNQVNFEIPLGISGGSSSKIKFGAAYLIKERNFNENIYEFTPSSNTTSLDAYDGNIQEYLEDNLGVIDTVNTSSGPRYDFGTIVRDQVLAGGSYVGRERLPAAYAMVDLQVTPKLKISTGARFERTDIELITANENIAVEQRKTVVEQDDILPAINITQQLVKDMNLRAAYGRTVARPTFRELAPYETFDFVGDAVKQGGPLERTLIDNFDLRWEYYPTPGEFLSVSAFYKKFQDPIETTIQAQTNEPDRLRLQFRNVDQATVMGMEFEARKDLSFISESLEKIKFGANVTILDSRVDINEEELNLIRIYFPDAADERVMFGQAPFIVNTFLMYHNPDSRTNLNIVYNVSGERLSYVNVGGTPNVFEQPRSVLDFTAMQGFGERFSVKVSAENLLNSAYKFTQVYKGVEYDYQNYQLGRSFSVGVSYLIE